MSQSATGRGVLAIVDPARRVLRPAFVRLGNRAGGSSGSPPGHTPGNVLVDRAMPALSGCFGHLGLGRRARYPLGFIAAGKWRRRLAEGVGLFFRPLSARREPVWADLRLLVTPRLEARGKPDGSRLRCCIAGAAWEAASRRGRSTMPRVLCVWFPRWPIQRLRHARPELRRSRTGVVCRPEPAAFDHRLQPKGRTTGHSIGQPLAEAKALLPKAVFLPADRRGPCRPLLDWRSNVSASPLWSGWKRVLCIPSALLSEVTGCTHLWDGEEPISRGVAATGAAEAISSSSRWLAQWERPGRWLIPRQSRWCPRRRHEKRSVGPARGGVATASDDVWNGWMPWDWIRSAMCFDCRARRWPAGLA